MTRQQAHLGAALDRVSELLQPGVSDKTRKAYGGLCHGFPVLVRTNGLCQALAFVHQKKSGTDDLAAAHGHLWRHVAGVLSVQNADDLLQHIRRQPSDRYLHETRLLLEAWIYYKRFAVSLLGVQPGEEAEAGETPA